jgi:membrane peptidoglycan carboxypeptidase
MSENGFQIRPVESRQIRWTQARPSRKRSNRDWKGILKTILSYPKRFVLWLVALKQRLGWKQFLLRAFGVGAGLVFLYIGFLWITLPSIDEQSILQASQSTVILDRNGQELYRIHGNEDRTIIPGTDMPKTLRNAIIAIEDKRYEERGCIDFRALARVAITFGQAGGASTITRQLARNALNLQRENIVNRKVKELILGCTLESKYSKEDLLTLYLNWIPFGQDAYGVEQASKRFLGKSTKDLTLGESAVLASLPQLPSYYSPYGRHVRTTVTDDALQKINSGKIKKASELHDDEVSIGLLGGMSGSGANAIYVGGRSDQVLQNMQDQKLITEEERVKAIEELKKLTFAPFREKIRAPHFVLWVREQVEKMFAGSPEQGLLERGGLTIQTTLDVKLQDAAEETIAKYKDTNKKVYMANNMALVALDPKTREILAYVGNTEYSDEVDDGKIDMVQEPRQPGSSFKPFVYASAFQNGYGPATVLWDVPTTFGDYEPQNFAGDFWGLMNARRALAGSRNIPAVKAYFLGGEEDEILDLAEAVGIPSAKSGKPAEGYGASLAIGSAEVPLMEMAQGYATLADGGRFVPANGIVKITDSRGALVALPGVDESEAQGTAALDPRIAYEVTSILSDTAARPNEFWKSVLSVPGMQAAAKTGTSNKCLKRDEKKNTCLERKPDNVWTLGYTPALVAGVWVGNASNEPLSDRADGLNVAAPIWRDFMAKAHKIVKIGETNFNMPSGLTQVQVSMLSGELPTECTPVNMRRSDIFLAEATPTKDDPACVRLMVDKVTGLLASDECPVEAREERSFLAPYNPAGKLFPQWDGDVTEWVKRSGHTGSGGTVTVGSGITLPLPLAPNEKCTLALTPGRTIKPTLKIVSPSDGGTAGYPSFKPKLSFTVGSSVRSMAYAIDGKPAGLLISAPWDSAVRIPKTIEKSGTHTLTVTLTDEYYNVVEASARITFETDSNGPSVMLLSPEPAVELAAGAPLVIRANANDNDGDVKYVEFFLDSTLLVRKPLAPYELTYSEKIPAGTHRIRAVATDLNGNEAEDEVTITVK